MVKSGLKNISLALLTIQILFVSQLAAVALARIPIIPSFQGTRNSENEPTIIQSTTLNSRLMGQVDDESVHECCTIVASATIKAEEEISLNAFDLCLCGAFATAFGDFVMHPVDTIKVTQQAAVSAVDMLTTAKNIFTKGGIGGFYPGTLITISTFSYITFIIRFSPFI